MYISINIVRTTSCYGSCSHGLNCRIVNCCAVPNNWKLCNCNICGADRKGCHHFHNLCFVNWNTARDSLIYRLQILPHIDSLLNILSANLHAACMLHAAFAFLFRFRIEVHTDRWTIFWQPIRARRVLPAGGKYQGKISTVVDILLKIGSL